MQQILDWLLAGDVSVEYLTKKYLLKMSAEEVAGLRGRIAMEGWGSNFLSKRSSSGHWSLGFYQVRWVCSHYTLLDLRNLEIEPVEPILKTLRLILCDNLGADGSVRESKSASSGDVCVNGMFLNYASFFRVPEQDLIPCVDFLLAQQLLDGGFNCRWKKDASRHSSMHTTISVLEGLREFQRSGYRHRDQTIREVLAGAEGFLLRHRLYQSDRTGRPISPAWSRPTFPCRWHYDILRALIYFADAGSPFDPRMADALEVLMKKRLPDGRWPLYAPHPGKVHFVMERPGEASRLNTLRALRVMDCFRT